MPTAGAHSPRISVLTAVYNGAQYLGRALESVRRQTFSDFEHVIVDDASTDGSWALLQAAATADSRCQPVRLSQNIGPAATLNSLLARARGEYVAILDHDDECAPERLEQQVGYLNAHPDVGVLGTLGYRTDEHSNIVKEAGNAEDDFVLRWLFYFGTPLIHSSVMMRTDLARAAGGYDPKLRSVIDYDLWLRLSQRTRFAVLPQRLAMYRYVPTGISQGSAIRQRAQMVMRLQAWLNEHLAIKAPLPVVTTVYLAVRKQPVTAGEAGPALALLAEICRRHIERNAVPEAAAAWIRANCAKRCRDIAEANANDAQVVALCDAARAPYETETTIVSSADATADLPRVTS